MRREIEYLNNGEWKKGYLIGIEVCELECDVCERAFIEDKESRVLLSVEVYYYSHNTCIYNVKFTD